jgi:hypothetical protein
MSPAIADPPADQAETYHLELKPAGDPLYRRTGHSRAPLYRLRLLLKHAGRECGFRIRWGRASPPVEPLDREHLEHAMIRLTDGPAAGQTLLLRRAPLYLRVVFNLATRKWDGLDQLGDTPQPGELIYAYRRVAKPGSCMLDWTEKGRRRGGCFAVASYAVVADPPDEATLRATEAWRQWCWDQVGKPRGTDAP